MARTRVQTALVLGLPVVIVVVIGFVIWHHGHAVLHTERGDPRQAFVAGSHLVLVDKVASGGSRVGSIAYGVRLSAIDLETGALAGEQVFEERAFLCWPAKGARVWCDEQTSDVVHLFELPTFRPVATATDLVTRAGGTMAPHQFGTDHGDLIVLLVDGTGVRIDSATLAVTKVDPGQLQGGIPSVSSCRHSYDHKIGDKRWLRFDGSPRSGLVIDDKNYGTPVAPPSAPTFLGGAAFIDLNAPDLFLIAHDKSLGEPRVHEISRVDTTPAVLWTAEVPSGCLYATIAGAKLVIAPSDPDVRALAIDVATGRALWRFAY